MRFETRTDDYKHYGVWDLTAEKWHGATDLEATIAEQIATELNARYSPAGPRPDATVRHISPPHPAEARVIAQRWRKGRLDLWIREPDGWHGHLWFQDSGSGVAAWFPADRLRPL
jgi:hypothetical protein